MPAPRSVGPTGCVKNVNRLGSSSNYDNRSRRSKRKSNEPGFSRSLHKLTFVCFSDMQYGCCRPHQPTMSALKAFLASPIHSLKAGTTISQNCIELKRSGECNCWLLIAYANGILAGFILNRNQYAPHGSIYGFLPPSLCRQ